MNVPHSKLSEQEIKDICDLKHKSKEFVLQQGDLNYAIADMMFNWLEAQGVVATNLKSLYSYFLFCFYPNSVYHFNVKGLSNKWKFGMWISNPAPYLNNEEEYKDEACVELFCQHTDVMDKFKPSRSDLIVSMSYNNLDNLLSGHDIEGIVFAREVKKMVQFIKYHPLMAYNGVCPQDCYPGYKHFITPFVKNKISIVKSNASEYVLAKFVQSRAQKLYNRKEVSNVKVDYCNFRSPKVIVKVKLKDSVEDKEVEKLINSVFKLPYPKYLGSFGYGEFSFEFNVGDCVYDV